MAKSKRQNVKSIRQSSRSQKSVSYHGTNVTQIYLTKAYQLLDDPKAYEHQLKVQLNALGLYASNTLGDGNCMFRALCDQIYGDENLHLDLRHNVCNFLEDNSELYAAFVEDDQTIDQHIRCMRENGTYGGHIELSAVANITSRPIKVIQPNLVYVVSAQDELPNQKNCNSPLYVAYHNWEHYSSVRNLNGPHQGLPYVHERDGISILNGGTAEDTQKIIEELDTNIDRVMECLPTHLQQQAERERISQLLTENNLSWETVIEHIIEFEDVKVSNELKQNEKDENDINCDIKNNEEDEHKTITKRSLNDDDGNNKSKLKPKEKRAKKVEERQKKLKEKNDDKPKRITRSMAKSDDNENENGNKQQSSTPNLVELKI